MRYARLVVTAVGILAAFSGMCAAANSFVAGDHIAFFVTEFTRVETAPDKSSSMISGITMTGRRFSIKATWGQLTACPDFLEHWKTTRRSKEKPYYIAGSLTTEAPMVVAMWSCDGDPQNINRARRDIY